MPIAISLKNPPLTFAFEEEIDKAYKKKKFRGLKCLAGRSTKGNRVLLPIRQDTNIAFIQEVSEEEAKKMFEKKESSVLSKVQPTFTMPGGKRRLN